MAAGIKSFSKTFVWILMGLLILGLAGFGAVNLTGTLRVVAQVGDQDVTIDEYARELDREIRAIQAQTGQTLTMPQIRASQLDSQVLSRLVALAAIDNETAEMGISIGDENLQKEILAIPAFQGIDGKFDREAYRFSLDRARIDEVAFENDLRAETARTLVQGAIVSGVESPSTLTDVLIDYIGARRSFTWARLDESSLDAPLPVPADDALKTYYEENTERFMLPETKRIRYVLMTPGMVLDQVEIDDEAVRKLYDERKSEFEVPERRLVERLAFADEEAAAQAMAQLDVGGTTFEALVSDRGLELSDVDLGDVTGDDLGDAADAVLAADVGQVVGPLPSPLGPALFRVNGVLAERITSFEDAEAQLRDELALSRAQRLIEAQVRDINDLLAGGATLEELAAETEMEAGEIDWTPQSADDIAAYEQFREVAQDLTAEDYPEVLHLDDGGIYAVELVETLDERPQPFLQARNNVARAWTDAKRIELLEAKAQTLVSSLATEGELSETGLQTRVENGLTRTAFVDGAPADFMVQVFDMEEGDVKVVSGDGAVTIVRLDEVLPPEETEELTAMRDNINLELSQALSQELFNAFVNDARTRAKPTVNQQALNAVQANFQ